VNISNRWFYLFCLDSYFIGGFKYDAKAVFGVIETSERTETVSMIIIQFQSIQWSRKSSYLNYEEILSMIFLLFILRIVYLD
jgi:hypothetical protein